jgi:hypothetical protein
MATFISGEERRFTVYLPGPPRGSPRRYRQRPHAWLMADFLVVVAIVGFVAAMLGLIWGLDRV